MNASVSEILHAVCGKRILVVGDVMLDRYVWGDASRLSPEAPVPVVRVDRESVVAGGAANVAFNLRSLGGAVSLFGRIGTDAHGEALRALLETGGVRLLEGSVQAGCPTISKTRVVCRRQQVCRLDREAESARYAIADDAVDRLLAPAIAEADAVVLSDYGKGLLEPTSIRRILSHAAGKLVTLDPKPRPGVDYRGVSLLTPNRAEALQLAGLSEVRGAFPAEEVCRLLYERFAPKHLVITLGADGMLLSEGGRPLERIPTVAREVFDVSGAGDTVIAALTLGLAAGFSLADAARFANVTAGVVVGKLGTATATPDEVLAYAASVR